MAGPAMGGATGVVQTSSGRCRASGVKVVPGGAADICADRALSMMQVVAGLDILGVSIDSATKPMR